MFGNPAYSPQNPSYQGINPPRHDSTRAFTPNRGDYRFYESTINYVYGMTPSRIIQQGSDGSAAPIPEGNVLGLVGQARGTVYREWQCAGCQHWFRYEALQIDHIQPIVAFWNAVQPSTWVEGMQAYNDVSNLRLMCSTCNTSHDWEPQNR
ncbi:MAG: HNH endonuclease signature motif containing protein [Phycisphaerales bacterium]